MAGYRKVFTRIWSDASFSRLSDDGKLVFLYVLTSPDMHSFGAMRGTSMSVAGDLGWEPDRSLRACVELKKSDLIEFDDAERCIAVPNFLHYNKPESPNVVRSWGRVWDRVPECELSVRQLARMKAVTQALGEAFTKAFLQAFPKGTGPPSGKEPLPLCETSELRAQNSDEDGSVSSTHSRGRKPSTVHVDWQQVVNRWNNLAITLDLRRIQFPLNETRQRKYRARLKAGPFWDVLECELPRLNAFSREKGFVTFDFVLSPTNLQKLAEGNYQEHDQQRTLSSHRQALSDWYGQGAEGEVEL